MQSHPRENRIDYIEFGVANKDLLARAVEFYKTVFGWNYQMWGEEYADTQASGVASGINADSDHRPRQPLVVLYVENLEAARSKVNEASGEVTKNIFSFPGGRRFHFKDPAGNELAIWSDR